MSMYVYHTFNIRYVNEWLLSDVFFLLAYVYKKQYNYIVLKHWGHHTDNSQLLFYQIKKHIELLLINRKIKMNHISYCYTEINIISYLKNSKKLLIVIH